ncbi:glycosyltransferase family 1 protein [Candidatus Parcubacteria bacterium]|nr:MAG: glycosyltransferase family 1 protein [Candidatus Parcubacteria bacterium]
MKSHYGKILIDCREFVHGRLTGIGRVLAGLIDALIKADFAEKLDLAVFSDHSVPCTLSGKEKIEFKKVSSSFFKSESALTSLSKQGYDLFISPYPKLPLFGTLCPSVNIIHDVLDLTHPAYKRRFKVFFDIFRLKSALKKADLTWFDSEWSRKETKIHFRMPEKKTSVRYPGIDESFTTKSKGDEYEILNSYRLSPGYIFVIGNGKPHKNLGIIIDANRKIQREIAFAGVLQSNQTFWKKRYPESRCIWLEYIEEEHISVLIRNAFCLAQPSTAEGYGYPPLEAMACGVPAVVSNIPVLIETTGGNAITADPLNGGDWIKAFQELEDDSFRKDQVERGLNWIKPLRGSQAWQGYISDLEDLLESEKRSC